MTARDRFLATLDPDRTARALELLTLAPEELLLVGGDDRQLPRAGTARNGYGLPIVDREPIVRGSSCTATPPDAVALADVAAWSSGVARALTTAGRLPSADTFHEAVASRIAAHLGLDATHTERIVLVPSGTDAESIATGLVLVASGRPLCNIVLGAAESGSGTVPAALGRYFARRTPFRGDVDKGEPITGLDPDRVRLVNVELRDRRGRARRAFDVEAEVEAHIEDALDRGEQVLVHAMAGSKTDLRQLSSDWVRIWRARGAPHVSVLIDAAQARVPSAAVRDFLAAGASVMVTGSKALGAPPFCGAIVLDPALMHGAMTAVSRGRRLPRGFAHIVALADMPRWSRGMLPGAQHANLGLLARWHVGLGELDRYRAIPSVWRADFTHRLCSAITAQLRSTPGIVVLDSDSPSIVSFGLRTASGDLAARAPIRDLYAALVGQTGVQFGQPVELAPGRAAVLRYAIGAVTASRAAASGRSPAEAAREATAAAIAAVRGALLEVQV